MDIVLGRIMSLEVTDYGGMRSYEILKRSIRGAYSFLRSPIKYTRSVEVTDYSSRFSGCSSHLFNRSIMQQRIWKESISATRSASQSAIRSISCAFF